MIHLVYFLDLQIQEVVNLLPLEMQVWILTLLKVSCIDFDYLVDSLFKSVAALLRNVILAQIAPISLHLQWWQLLFGQSTLYVVN